MTVWMLPSLKLKMNARIFSVRLRDVKKSFDRSHHQVCSHPVVWKHAAVFLFTCCMMSIEKYPTTPSDGLHAKLLKLKSEVEVQDPAEFVPPVHEPLLVASDLASELEQTIEQTKRILQVKPRGGLTFVKCD
ncbi:unnamed protein product [Clavelina lepadiformis]|uniref:Uncharacterized protein n=1 Tax=Clavelina lepadiformis TaxID=159417 RepID=A0ABP0G8G0_CLALP